MIKFPRQQNQEGGWTIDSKFLSKIADSFSHHDNDFLPGLEGLECVLLALENTLECTVHDSDCSMHNMPAYPNGPCDCSRQIVGEFENSILREYLELEAADIEQFRAQR